MDDYTVKIINKIQALASRREELLQMPLAPEGAWLHEYSVFRRYKLGGELYEYRYLKWQASQPIFERNPKKRGHRGKGRFTCHQHVGRLWSSTGLGADPQAEAALAEMANRRELEAIDQAFVQIEKALLKVMLINNEKT